MIVNVFKTPYEVWTTRAPTMDEVKQAGRMLHSVNDKLLYTLNNHLDAAKHMLIKGADNALAHFIEDYLNESADLKKLRSAMPSKTPASISTYQQQYPQCNLLQVNNDIGIHGIKLDEENVLFHGGFWPPAWGTSYKTDKPLSTTFCPQVALRNAEHNGKAYDAGEIHLLVLKVVNPKTKAFIFRQNGTNLGHEKEVLFSSGAILTLRSKTLIKNDYRVAKSNGTSDSLIKEVPAYVVEIYIS